MKLLTIKLYSVPVIFPCVSTALRVLVFKFEQSNILTLTLQQSTFYLQKIQFCNSVKINLQQFKLNYFTKRKKPKEYHQNTYTQCGKFTHNLNLVFSISRLVFKFENLILHSSYGNFSRNRRLQLSQCLLEIESSLVFYCTVDLDTRGFGKDLVSKYKYIRNSKYSVSN